MKKEISVNKANRLINNGPLVLVSTQYNGKTNIFTVAWNMPVTHTPVSVAISSGYPNYSTRIIEETGEFVINIPDKFIKDKVINCGKVHGNEIDKFKEFNLTPSQSRLIKTPGVEECIGHLECRVEQVINLSDHKLFIAKVLFASVEESKWNFQENVWNLTEANLLHHLGGPYFE